jgi:hypothetical protein
MRSEIRSEVNKVELADKIKTIMATAWKWKPGIYHISIQHDDGCPAIRTQSMVDCTCNPVITLMKPYASDVKKRDVDRQ